jgi:hypothetical protein
VPTTYPSHTRPSNFRRPRWRRVVIILVVIAALLGAASYGVYTLYRHITTALVLPGCQAGTGANAVSVDPDQAPVAATIAGVAARMGLSNRALAIAYATALQESKLTNLTYGDRDSVGVFQQRPSEGWGTTAQLEDPQYASTAFFKALVKVPDYLKIPEYQAAQDVQHSAEGSAYEQWQTTAEQLAAAYTATPHAVTCWYQPAAKAKPQTGTVSARMTQVFGPASREALLTSVTATSTAMKVDVTATQGWTVANWLMSHASMYGLTRISYDGWQWSASLTETTWQHVPGGVAGSILAS